MNVDPPRQLNTENREGFALESAIFALVIVGLVMAALMAASMTTFRTSSMEIGRTQAIYASEAGAEAAMAHLMAAVEDGYLSDTDLATIAAPSIPGFTFDSFTATRNGGAVVETITDGTFAGLSSLTQRVDVFSSVTDPMGNSAATVVSAKAQAIPIFQFGVFYEKDLEITNSPPMTFDGWVHTNANLYLNSNNAWYKEQVTAVGEVYRDHKYKHDTRTGIYITDASGTDVYMDFDSRTDSNPDDFKTKSESYFDSRLRTNAHGVDTLRLPIPDGVPAEVILAPRDGTDGPALKASKWAWKADLHLVVDLDHSSLHNPSNDCGAMTFTRTGTLSAPSATECATFLSFDFEAYMDGREQHPVDVLNIDIDKMYDWIATSPGSNQVSLFYVEFVGTGMASVGPLDGLVYPVVRVKNGSALDAPLSIATARPLHVQGDYNTVGWQPAALVGDVITFLSNAWVDSNHPPNVLFNDLSASNTTIFAALMAGHSAPWCDHEVPPCPAVVPTGGAFENFPRHLENWSGITFAYRGSIVSLHNTLYGTMQWGWGDYYLPPIRDWLFDTRFRNPANLPPGTPVVGNVLRTAFRPVF